MSGERDKDVERDRLAAESIAVSRRNGELSDEVGELSDENESLRRRVQQLEEWLKLPPTEAADVPSVSHHSGEMPTNATVLVPPVCMWPARSPLPLAPTRRSRLLP